MDLKTLTAIFRKLGASKPERWAASQLNEGIPQLARYLFLRQAWRAIVPVGDPSWIDAAVNRAQAHPEEPFSGAGHAIQSLRSRGATDDELTELVRAMQAELLFQFCHLLEDAGDVEPEARGINWSLMQTGEHDDSVIGPLTGLHESVLETDPTGREARPRPVDA